MTDQETTMSGSEGSNSDVDHSAPEWVVMPSELMSHFECPVCYEYVCPPIMQCRRGHLACNKCRPRLHCCPTCRGPLEDIRNVPMEMVAERFMFPGKSLASGRPKRPPLSAAVEHEQLCASRHYKCPCPGQSCGWRDRLDRISEHIMIAHRAIPSMQSLDMVFLASEVEISGPAYWVTMQGCFGQHFMHVLKKQMYKGCQHFFSIVQLFGSQEQSERFTYTVVLNGHDRRLTWEGRPRSIDEGISTAISNCDCLVFCINMAKHFLYDDCLTITVRISTRA